MGVAGTVQKGYMGCFADAGGDYTSRDWGAGRNLPVVLPADLMTLDQCAQYAASMGYEVFAIQGWGVCSMGSLRDVAAMKRRMEDTFCTFVPCLPQYCKGFINKVFAFGMPV